ncbi:MAG TPA: diacylglycerol kinase family protein [Candidatus Wallbacteria bacterium]|nr:diacylglycerol kinase family protein [Candidatus Wallbacteria bacterium]
MAKEKEKSETKPKYKIALIINEYSKGGDYRPLINEELYRQLDDFQKSTGHPVAVSFTRSKTHIQKAVTSLQREGHNFLIICGGDGTINDVIQHVEEGTLIVPIPGGNANDFARRLNIFHWRDSVQIIKNIVEGNVNIIGIDAGEISFHDKSGAVVSRRFLNNCGVGVTADTVRRVEGRVDKAYLKNGFLSLMLSKAFGLTYYSTILKKNINMSCLGFEMLLCSRVGRYANFAPYKHENDGTIHFIIFKNLSYFKRLMLMMLLSFGERLVSSGFVEYFHGHTSRPEIKDSNSFGLNLRGVKSIWGMLHDKALLHVDGNLVPEFYEIIQSDCKVRILPKFIKTVAPC